MNNFQESDEAQKKFVRYYKKYKDSPLKVLLGFYKGQYHKFLLSGLFYLIKHAPTLISPLLIANVINGVLAGGEAAKRAVLINAGIWLALLIVHLPTNYMYSAYRSSVTRETEAGLRSALVRKLQELSIPYHTRMQSGRLQSKIIRDVEAIETLSSQLFNNVLNIVLNLAITIGITAVKNRIILLFFVLVAPAASLTVVLFRRRIGKVNRDFRIEMEETSAKVMEMVEMVPVTRAHALEEVESRKMSKQLRETAKKGYRLDITQANFGAAGWVVFQVFQAVCLMFTGFMAISGRILVGDITFYQTSFTTVVNQFTALINLLPIITKGLESVKSVGEVLSSDDIEQNEGKEKLQDVKGDFEFQHVGYVYPERTRWILKDIDLKVSAGETIAIVGESGSGKTTLMNILVGFMLPKKGKLLIDGKDISSIDLKSYRRFLSVVPQNPLLFTGTLRENITYGLGEVPEEKVLAAVEAANLTTLVERKPQGLDTMLEEHGANLSGGQRQRIAIARALIRDPKVIVLDEATSALDAISEKEIQGALERLQHNRTTFVVAHRLSTIKNADRIVVLDRGVIAEIGTYAELMEKKGLFYKMESLQMNIVHDGTESKA